MTRLNTASSALLLGAILLTACGEKTKVPAAVEPAAVEAVSEVETSGAVVSAGALTAVAVVEESTDESPDAFVIATEVQTLTATVVSINLETRDVVLVGEDGVELSLVASEKTNNLDQVNPGDTVNAKFMERMTIELVQGETLRAQDTTLTREIQAEAGEMPARAEAEVNISVYTVEAIDLEANTFKLKNVKGEVKQFSARNPAHLAKASVGDSVVITTTEAMAVEVIKATAE